MYTVATVTIAPFTTDLRLTADNWRRGQPAEFVNVLGDGPYPYNGDPVPYLLRSADVSLSQVGHERITDWARDPDRHDVHTATIRPTG